MRAQADGLNYRAFFAEGYYRVFPWLGVLARYEERHALNGNKDAGFIYLVDIGRVVGGVRFDISPNLILKLEYLYNFELDPVPTFSNNVITSSLVVAY